MNIILAHGILGFDKVLGIEYFNGIKEHLENRHRGAKVWVSQVDPTDSIITRGDQLRAQILTVLSSREVLNPDDETHIIAHSMGGLDSRYVLSPDNEANAEDDIAQRITSLTTIGTPHTGSPVADLIYRALDGEADGVILRRLEEKIVAALAFLGISNAGLRDLTTAAMRDFNAKYRDNAGVRYFWAAGIGRSGVFKTSALFLPFHELILLMGQSADDRKSDGVVPLSSAKREANGWAQVGDLWPADHAEEVGHDLDDYVFPFGVLTNLAETLKAGTGVAPPPSPEILAHYDEILARIAPLKKH